MRVLFAAILVLFACAPERSVRVQGELARLNAAAVEGTDLVSRALADPTFQDLGEGVRTVEIAVRALETIESDPTISDIERLDAILIQARAWKELGTAFDRGAAVAETEATANVLLEKATPAHQVAEDTMLRAATFACERQLLDHAGFVERPTCPGS